MTAKVYFIAAPGRIKIGFTRRPEKRLVALRRADMEELSVIAIIDGSRFLERTLHNILEAHKIRGEWFTDCAEVRAEIDSAIAGRYPLEAEKPLPIMSAFPEEIEELPFSPEFQIVSRLCDEVEAALDRNADKYEVRGYARAFLAASQMFIEQRGGWPIEETER